MCTYATEQVPATGAGKGPGGWFSLSRALVYYDHPHHAGGEHTVNLDFINPEVGPSARVAVELSVESARALVQALQATLEAVS